MGGAGAAGAIGLGMLVTGVAGCTGCVTGGFTATGGFEDAGVEEAGVVAEPGGWTGVDGRGIRVIGVIVGALLIFGNGEIGVRFPVGGGIRVTGVDTDR